ncbi:alpha/beta hydrolase [Priestia taiwanensis]|uniref:Alpha/beta hydrolase n=1 Tax=Priestia taiwanensis TaxID=1347902 RepID=A0A917AW15_9BACI|nr:alpha/beta hydrolase [Priestia taiwanensis]MBM7363374.1 alpha-beta hydrolase superfamily lysophospholipase [Priestia taiwanensis]GGE77697.1 alpha/beta hydrolase [Priestia taiwanensis]
MLWEGTIPSHDGTLLYVRKRIPSNVRAVIQMAHGMTEHGGVYDEFIDALVAAGFAVYIHDHRGHGKTALEEDLGHLEPKLGWNHAVQDIIFLSEHIREEVDAPLFLLGHSMGSFLSRRVVQLRDDLYDGLLLSGTGASPGLLGKLGEIVAKFEMTVRGKRTKSPLLNHLSFGSFNAHFKPAATESDWLSSDPQQVQRYMNDPLCGFICTTSFYKELFSGVAQATSKAGMMQTPTTLPIYLFSGDRDPVGDMGKGVQQSYNLYRKCGVQDVTIKLYKDGRHEMFHEVNRQDVFQDVIHWLHAHIRKNE